MNIIKSIGAGLAAVVVMVIIYYLICLWTDSVYYIEPVLMGAVTGFVIKKTEDDVSVFGVVYATACGFAICAIGDMLYMGMLDTDRFTGIFIYILSVVGAVGAYLKSD